MMLHHRLEGPEGAPVLVLLASLGATLEMWDPQVHALAGPFRLLRVDRRGHGGSAVVPGPATIDHLGGDLLDTLDTLGVERASVCGLSLGGVEAIWAAVHAPERVERLVLCCTMPSFPAPQGWVDRAATVRSQGVVRIADAVLERWFTAAFLEREPAVAARYREMLVATPAEGYAACCEALATADLWPDVGRVRAPTLVLTGAADPVVTPADGERLRAAMPGAAHVVVEDGAHVPNVEQPDRVSAVLLEHLCASEEAA